MISLYKLGRIKVGKNAKPKTWVSGGEKRETRQGVSKLMSAVFLIICSQASLEC